MTINSPSLQDKWTKLLHQNDNKEKVVRNYCHEILNQLLNDNLSQSQIDQNVQTDIQKLQVQLMLEDYLQENQLTIQDMDYYQCMKFILWQIQRKNKEGDPTWQISQENMIAIKQIVQRQKQEKQYDLLQENKRSSQQYKQLLNLSKQAMLAKSIKKYPINHINIVNSNSYKIQKKHSRYLDIIFEHYCRTDGGRKLKTFQQVQLHFYNMQLHVWMLFCKDFEFFKLPRKRKDDLIQIFKKTATDYKDMTRQQFQQALVKIAFRVYQDHSKNKDDGVLLTQNQDNNSGDTKSIKSLFQYMEIESSASFKQKARKLNIKYNIKHKTDDDNNGLQQSEFMKHSQRFKHIKSKVRQQIENFEKKPYSQQYKSKKSQKSQSLQKLKKNLIKNQIKSKSLKKIQIINYRKPVFQSGYLKVFKMKNGIDPDTPMQQKNNYKLNKIVDQARKQMESQNPQKNKINQKTFSSILMNDSGVKNQLQELLKLSKNNKGKKNKIDIKKMAQQLVSDLVEDDQSEDQFLNALKLQKQ